MANRFLVAANASIDIATGRPVVIRRLGPCDAPDERRWVSVCQTLAGLWHEDMPSLIDFGPTQNGRFEAYAGGPPGVAPEGSAVRAFLAAQGLGDSEPRDRPGEGIGAPRLGLRRIPHPAAIWVGELLDAGRAGRPRTIACMAAPGGGTSTFLELCARTARLRGYVAVCSPVLDRWPALLHALEHRHVLLLCDADVDAEAGERWLLRLARVSPAGHVLLRSGAPPGHGDARITLAPLSPRELVAALHVHPPHSIGPRRIQQAAAESGGLPGVFVSLLRSPARAARILRVAETRPAYVSGPTSAAVTHVEHPWADMLDRAERLTAAGRRAAAERDLRQIAAAAERRQMGAVVSAAHVRLGWLLLDRGRLEAAQQLFRNTGDVASALAVAELHVERGEMEHAESILRVARSIEVPGPSIALARCLAWQARYAEVTRCLEPLRKASEGAPGAIMDSLLARVSLANGDIREAARLALRAIAGCGGDTARDAVIATIDAHEVLFSVHARLGDQASVEHHGVAALAKARRHGLGLRYARIRAALLEARSASGMPVSRRVIERLLPLAPRLPALSRARLWLLGARLHPSPHERHAYADRLREFVVATGTAALLPDDPHAKPGHEDVVSELVQIQERCIDPPAALRTSAEWLLKQLDARAVHVANADGGLVVHAGSQERLDVIARVLRTRTPQPPWADATGVQAGVPVRYAGRLVGALAARWLFADTADGQAVSRLVTTAAFLAPALAALEDATDTSSAAASADGIIGRSQAIARLRDTISRAAPSPFPVLIEGESGSGKELVARAIHEHSARRKRPWVAINCAALGDDLLEAELFGHVRGAYTGAHTDRAGLFEQADSGTLFLDEVSELSPRAQAKLLRVLQDGEVRRVGENITRKVDVRIIAASNRRLADDVTQERFRKDLLFRLAVVRVMVPSLRDRAEDIPLLVAHYWRRGADAARSRAVLTTGAVGALARYDWPGNVRELQNVMAALAVQVPRGRVTAAHVAAFVGETRPSPGTLEDARREFERAYVGAALARSGGRHGHAARELGVTRQGLGKLVRRLGLDAQRSFC